MGIEADINRIANSLELIAAHVTGTEITKKGPGRPRKTETVDPAPDAAQAGSGVATQEATTPVGTPAAAPAPIVQGVAGVTVEQLQKLVGEKVGQGKREGVLKTISESGADRASTVPAEKRDAVYAAIQAL